MSIIYEMTCLDCGRGLYFEVKLDASDDLLVAVEACSDCIDDAIKEKEEQC
jgi:uncharacterized protein YcgI (DUF1989 family)